MKIKYTIEFELTDTNQRMMDFVELGIDEIEDTDDLKEIFYEKLNEKHGKDCTCVGDCAPYCECDDVVEVDHLKIKDREFIKSI